MTTFTRTDLTHCFHGFSGSNHSLIMRDDANIIRAIHPNETYQYERFYRNYPRELIYNIYQITNLKFWLPDTAFNQTEYIITSNPSKIYGWNKDPEERMESKLQGIVDQSNMVNASILRAAYPNLATHTLVDESNTPESRALLREKFRTLQGSAHIRMDALSEIFWGLGAGEPYTHDGSYTIPNLYIQLGVGSFQ